MVAQWNLDEILQTKWTITSWSEDEEATVEVFQSIEDICWENDELLATGLDYEPHPVIVAFFASKGRKLSVHNVDLYTIDRRTALIAELRLVMIKKITNLAPNI